MKSSRPIGSAPVSNISTIPPIPQAVYGFKVRFTRAAKRIENYTGGLPLGASWHNDTETAFEEVPHRCEIFDICEDYALSGSIHKEMVSQTSNN
jgi:hypothetical protein